MWLSVLVEKMIKEAFDNGKFAQIQEYYKIADWKIVTQGGYRVPSIYDLEALVRSLCRSIEDPGVDYVLSGGIFVKLCYNEMEQEVLSFGFIDVAAEIHDEHEKVKIIDQDGNELKIIAINNSENNLVYQIKYPGNNKLINEYNKAIKDRIWSKEND